MKKFFKKMAMLVGMFTIFLMTTSTYATLRCPEDGDAYIEITHGDKAISNGSLTGAYAYTKVGPVYFQDVDATKMLYQTIFCIKNKPCNRIFYRQDGAKIN